MADVSHNLPMRTPLPRLVIARVRARDPERADALIRAHALPSELERESTIVAPVDALAHFYDAAAAALEDDELGLTLATEMPRGAYGLFEFGLRAESTLRGALDRLCKTMALFNRVAQLDWSIVGSSVRCEMAVPGRPRALGRQANEFFVALLVSWAREMVEGTVAIERVWFCHARPERIDAHARVFGCAVIEFDASSNGFAFAAAGLDARLREADPALRTAIDERARAELPPTPQPTLLFELRRELASSTGEIAMRSIARRLGHSPRSLQRHLAEAGTTFRRVHDELRRDRVRELQRQGVGLEAIAERLGYADLGAFRRALRRWGT
jgi:AraC-like DNA-binding protein